MRNWIGSFVTAALLCGTGAFGQDNGYWKAMSTTARGITGDVAISGERLTINFAGFTIADIRSLTADETHSLFNVEADNRDTGKLYRLDIPAKKTFLHRNTMCGAEDTQWMATFVRGKELQLAFLSGSKMPALTSDALATSTALCGTFSYTR